MFDLGWDEMAVIAVLALIVLGPKELPNALRTMSMVMKNARKLASEFQSGVNDIIREADLEEARKKLNEIQTLNKGQIQDAIQKAVDPTGEVKSAFNTDPTMDAMKIPEIGGTPESGNPEIGSPEIGSAAIGSAGADIMGEGESHAVETAAAEPVMVPLPQAEPKPSPEPIEPSVAEKS
jgi:sec-independent protein translocase protein TatB